MSAPNNLNPVQLQMFMPAGEIKQHYPSVDTYPDELASGQTTSTNSTMARKLRTARNTGLYQNIAERGVEKPVRLHQTVYGDSPPPWATGWLGNGGHRVASQADIDPNRLVPVEHDKDFRDVEEGNPNDHTHVLEYATWNNPKVRARHGA